MAEIHLHVIGWASQEVVGSRMRRNFSRSMGTTTYHNHGSNILPTKIPVHPCLLWLKWQLLPINHILIHEAPATGIHCFQIGGWSNGSFISFDGSRKSSRPGSWLKSGSCSVGGRDDEIIRPRKKGWIVGIGKTGFGNNTFKHILLLTIVLLQYQLCGIGWDWLIFALSRLVDYNEIFFPTAPTVPAFEGGRLLKETVAWSLALAPCERSSGAGDIFEPLKSSKSDAMKC